MTNDDGVHAPGLAALAHALGEWVQEGPDRSVIVVAPLANHSGASSAVGTVYERSSIAYRAVRVPGAESVPAYGLDASPALTVIIGALGGFGTRPDLVVSGINLGANVGRSVLHSGTVGAVLTGAQLGLSGLAVSMRSGAERDHWETPARLAVSHLPVLGAAPSPTVLSLNSPSVPVAELRGVRRGHIGVAGIIKAADAVSVEPGADGAEGEVRLTLGTAIPSLGDLGTADPDDDVALLASGYASLTPLLGVKERTDPEADAVIAASLKALREGSGP